MMYKAQARTGDMTTHACGQLAKCPSIHQSWDTCHGSFTLGSLQGIWKHPPALQTQSKLFKTTQPLWSGPVSAGQLVPDDICQRGANLCTNSGKCIGDTEKLEAISLAFGLNVLVLDVLVATHSGLPLWLYFYLYLKFHPDHLKILDFLFTPMGQSR